MGIILTSRVPYTAANPLRPKRPATSKIIFLSMEGIVTEEEYFEWVSRLFDEVKTKIQFISVVEDAVHTREKYRTQEQRSMLGRSKPKHLVEKIEQFKIEQNDKYQFDKYKEDEFWIVTDIDDNLSDFAIEGFHRALDRCDERGYGYAVSNPFFELWLLLHHDNIKEEDEGHAVTESHAYEKTDYFIKRLKDCGAPLCDSKHIRKEDYTKEKIIQAVERAKSLHTDREGRYPKYLATTVYRLLEKILELAARQGN
ncbi:MAG: RloB domain-containing protein [Lachnospiraceae bacterium]|nr:RloB domain-containing protein [Lachnospiraceae bacterium]